MNLFCLLLSLTMAYLMGSLLLAPLLARWWAGRDIYAVGTRNPGAANVYRQIGLKAGLAVGAFDILKGAAAVLVAQALVGTQPLALGAVGLLCVAGHKYPVFFRFRGGAGLAPVLGILAALLPLQALIALALAVPLLRLTPLPTARVAYLGVLLVLLLGVVMHAELGLVLAGAAVAAAAGLDFWLRRRAA